MGLVQTLVDRAVARLVSPLVGYAEVLNVLADVLETESSSAGGHPEINHNMMFSAIVPIVD